MTVLHLLLFSTLLFQMKRLKDFLLASWVAKALKEGSQDYARTSITYQA